MTVDVVLNLFLIFVLRLPDRHPRRGQHRLYPRARVRAERLPAAPQRPSELAAADQAVGGLGADRGASSPRSTSVLRRGRVHLGRQVRLRLDKTWIARPCSPSASCSTSGARSWRTAGRPAARGNTLRCHRRRRTPARRPGLCRRRLKPSAGAELPFRELRDRPAVAPPVVGPEEKNQSITASGSRMKTEKMLPVRVKNIARASTPSP